MTWTEFIEWLDVDNPAASKDCGWYVAGVLQDLRRSRSAVVSRSALVLDADQARPDLRAELQHLGCAAVAHTTWRHATAERDRYRVVLPLARDVSTEEYRRLATAVMESLGADQFDRGSDQAERLMHRPSAQNASYGAYVLDGEPLDPDPWLERAPDQSGGRLSADRREVGCACPQAPAVHPWAAAAVEAELKRLDALGDQPWKPGSRWDDTSFQVACNLREIANTPCCGYDLDEAERAFLARAPQDEAWGEARNREKWSSAKATVGDGQRPCRFPPDFSASPPEPRGGTAAAGGGSPGKVGLAVQLRRHIEANYDVFPAGNDSRIFAQPKQGGRAELLGSSFVIRAAAGLGSSASTLSTAATEAAKILAAEAEVQPPRELSLRVHSARGRIVLDLAQQGNSRCVVVTPRGWAIEDVPPADVAFQAAGRTLPDPVRGGSIDELRELLRWAEDDSRWPLVKGWLPSALLANRPRPLLGFFGPQGSAKSTTGRFVIGVLDPKPAGALGGGFGKNRSDDETKALASYLVAWDNVSALSSEGADLISRLVTGDLIEKRRLYTDAEVATIAYRRTGIVTGISVPRGVKADTLDRIVQVELTPLAARVSEDTLEEEWQLAHPRVLAGVLDLAVAALAGSRENPDGLRMGDYAENLWAIDPALYWAYATNVRDARSDMARNDPFITTLRTWLRVEGPEWEGTASEARGRAAMHHDWDHKWWPSNGKTFMDMITRNLELLKEVGLTVTERKVGGERLKRFTLVEEHQDAAPPDAGPVAQNEELL